MCHIIRNRTSQKISPMLLCIRRSSTRLNKQIILFQCLIVLISCISIDATKSHQPQTTVPLHHRPKGLYYSPSRGGGGSISNAKNGYYNHDSKWGLLSSNNKIKSVAWTPETIKALMICDDISALEDEEIVTSSATSQLDLSRPKNLVIHKARINKNNPSQRFVLDVSNRASRRMHMASDVCRDLSHACHVAVNHATDRSIGAKIFRTMKYKLLLHREDNEDILSTSESLYSNGILEEEERHAFLHQADTLLNSVSKALEDESIWSKLIEKDGVVVWRSQVDVKNYPSCLTKTAGETSNSDHATVRSEAIMSASPKDVYELFSDNSRVHEYNDNCKELEDLEMISSNAKISWSATGKFGPFAARDFVSLVTFKPHGNNGSYVSLAVHVDHPKLAPVRDGYVRSQIQLAATIMHAVPGQPNLTRLVQVTQVGELGGVADSAIAKRITSNLVEKAPVEFMKKFNNAVNRRPTTVERKEI